MRLSVQSDHLVSVNSASITSSLESPPSALEPVLEPVSAPGAPAPVAPAPVAPAPEPVAPEPVSPEPIPVAESTPVMLDEQDETDETDETDISTESVESTELDDPNITDQELTSETSEPQSYVITDPIIETYILSIRTELKKQIPLNKSRDELFEILGENVSNQSNIVDKFMNYRLGGNIKLKDIFINVFRNYTSENAKEEKNTAIQALFNNIKEYGMIYGLFSIEFLLSADNLFNKDLAYNDLITYPIQFQNYI